MLSSDFSPWHNYALPEDVNNDGEVTLMDSALAQRQLLGIGSAAAPKRLNGGGAPLNGGQPSGGAMFPDVNADNEITTQDVAQITRHLGPGPEGQLGTPEVLYDLAIENHETPGTIEGEGVNETPAIIVLDEGDTFDLIVYISDIRTGVDPLDMGVARGHVNINQLDNNANPTTFASAQGPIVHGGNYLEDPFGSVAPGLIDRAGGSQTIPTTGSRVPLGPTPQELFRVTMRAETVGFFSFQSETPPIDVDWQQFYSTVLWVPAEIADPATEITWDELFIEVATAPVNAVTDTPTVNEANEPPTPTPATVIDVLGNDLTNGTAAVPGELFITGITNATPDGFGNWITANGGLVTIVNFGGNLSAAIEYTPADDFVSGGAVGTGPGPDTFGYIASDFFGNTSEGTVEVTVVNVDNDPPVAVPDPGVTADPAEYETDEDNTLVLTTVFGSGTGLLLNDYDPDYDVAPTILSVDDSGTTGTATLNPDGTVTYDPAGQFEDMGVNDPPRTDTFTYMITDGVLPSNSATVTITINGVNDPPETPPGLIVPIDLGTTGDNTDVDFPLSNLGITDPDGDTLNYLVLFGGLTAQQGLVSIDNTNPAMPMLNYDPDGSPLLDPLLLPTETLGDSFTILVSDGNGGQISIPFVIEVYGEDDPLMPGTVLDLWTYTDEALDFYAGINLPAGQTPNVIADWIDPDSGVILTVTDPSDDGAPVTDNGGGSVTYDPTGHFDLLVYPATDDDKVFITVTSDHDAGQTYDIEVDIELRVDPYLPDISGTVIYADVNQNGQHDPWERTIAGVQLQLTGIDLDGNPVNLVTTTDAQGNYAFGRVLKPLPGTQYTLTEIQPWGIVEGISPVINENIYSIETKADVLNTDYVFGELGLYPLFIHPQDYLASTRKSGIVFGLTSSGNQLWYSLQDGWDTAVNVEASMNAAGTQLTLTVDGKTTTISTINNPDFFHRGANNRMMVVQIYGSQAHHGLL